MLDGRLALSLWALRLVLGTGAIASGVQRWQGPGTLGQIAGLCELLAGVLVFTPLTELSARLLSGWLMLGALAALLPGGEGLGACNVLLATSAFTLARLTHVNEAAGEGGDALAVGRAGSRAPEARRTVSGGVSPLPLG